MSVVQFLKSKVFFKQVVIAIIAFVILIFILKFWLGFTTNHEQRIQVPNLHKMTLTEVRKKLDELNLDLKVLDSASYNPDYPKKSVIEQNPIAGDFVKAKRKIYLVLNPSKYRDISIPDLNGRTKRQATTELKSIGFKVSSKSYYIPDIGKDVVRGLKTNNKTVNPGDKLPKNTTLELVLGDGKQ